MNLTPLLEAPLVIQIHVYSVLVAFFLGILQFVAPKGTLPHKTVGLIWLGAMIITTISSALIQRPVEPGDPFWARFSFIHGFTVLTAVGIFGGLFYLLRGGPALKKHASPFKGIFIGGILIAGAFAFLPGRIMHEVVFGG